MNTPNLRRASASLLITLVAVVATACQGAGVVKTASPSAVAGVVPVSSPATLVPVAESGFADMPMYRMDPTRQGVQPGPGPEGQPQLVWSAKAGDRIETSPIIGDGTLFIGSDDGFLYGLDARTGADVWRLDLGAAVPASAVYGAGVVAVADQGGLLHGVDATTGSELWHQDPVMGAAPALAGGIVYISGKDHRVHGFDLKTGTERWSWAAPADLTKALAVGPEAVYVATNDGMFHAVTLAGSTEAWSYQLSGTDIGYPIVSGDVILVNVLQGAGEPSGELFALDRASGKLLWRFRGPSGLQISLGSVRDGILYAPTQSDGIYAFRVADGTQVWHAAGPLVFFPTALVGDTLYLTSESPPEVAAVKASDGTAMWALPMSGVPKGNPVVTGGMLFEADASGEIRAFASQGSVAAAPIATPRPLTTPPPAATVANPFKIIERWSNTELGLDRPIAMAIGPSGDAYVAEASDRISQIAPDGTVVRRWGTEGSKAGEFDFVGANIEDGAHASIAVGPDGKVYVSDSDNHRVQVFSADGDFVRQFGSFGEADGQFIAPFDLSADAKGNVYVLDDSLVRLSKFGPDGAFLWAVDGTSLKELGGNGHDADIDSKGRIVLGVEGEGQAARVVYLDANGKVVDTFSADVCNVTVDPSGNAYVSNSGCGGNETQVFDPAHKLIGSWSGPDMSLAASPQFGPDGEILALDRDGGIVKLKVTLAP